MTPAFQNKLQTLLARFANEIIELLQSQPLSEITGSAAPAVRAASKAPKTAKKKADTRPRRSTDEIDEMIGLIAEAVKSAETGMNNEELQRALSIEKKDLTRPLVLALERKAIRKEGNKRSTRYFALTAEATKDEAPATKKPKKRGATVVYADGVTPPPEAKA